MRGKTTPHSKPLCYSISQTPISNKEATQTPHWHNRGGKINPNPFAYPNPPT